MPIYTSADWRVKPGHEQEFIDTWREMAEWTESEYDQQGWAKLLEDRDNRSHFINVAEWPDDQTVQGWRATDEYKQRLAKLRDLLNDLTIRTFDLAADVKQRSAEGYLGTL